MLPYVCSVCDVTKSRVFSARYEALHQRASFRIGKQVRQGERCLRELKAEQPSRCPSRQLAREASTGRRRVAGTPEARAALEAGPCRLFGRPSCAVRVLELRCRADAMNTPPTDAPAAVVTPTLQQLPRLDGFWFAGGTSSSSVPAIIDWSTAREAPVHAVHGRPAPRWTRGGARRAHARRRAPVGVMHVIARDLPTGGRVVAADGGGHADRRRMRR